MTEDTVKSDSIGKMFDQNAPEYANFADSSFSWQYIEKPAIQAYLEKLITPETKILDIGTGTGRVIQLLTEMGVPQENITGIDVSDELLKISKQKFPEASLIQASASDFQLPNDSFDIVVANMVFQYLDNNMLKKAFDNVYDVLKSNGKFCIIDPHPLHSEEAKRGTNNNDWMDQKTPWKNNVRVFNRSPWDQLDIQDFTGFGFVEGWWELPISDEGKIDSSSYQRYTSHPSRIGYLLKKMDEEWKQRVRSDMQNQSDT